MSSYPERGFVVGNGSSVSHPLVTGSRLRSVKIFFCCLQYVYFFSSVGFFGRFMAPCG